MELRAPDPIAAAHNLERIPVRIRALSKAFVTANKEAKRFPDWREYQIQMFMRYTGLYAADISEGHRKGRLDSVAQAARNLMELSIWTQYCKASEENAKRFFDDTARDVREMMEVLQKLYTGVNKKPEKKIESILAAMENTAAKFKIEDYDEDYTRVSDAAKKVGKRDIHSRIYKVMSKFAHPTALVLNIHDSLPDLIDSFYEAGATLANACLAETEKCIRMQYPDLRYQLL